MIVSMTGFGKASVTLSNKTIKTEIRTLNSKNLDLNLKLPPAYREKENIIRNMVSGSLERGKAEVSITIETTEAAGAQNINTDLLIHYYKQIKQVADQLGAQISDNFIADLLRLPEVLKPQSEEIDALEWEAAEKSISDALEQVNIFRQSEGKHLFKDITNREKTIRDLLSQIVPLETQRISTVRERILRSLKEIAEDIKSDHNRFEQEMIFYLEKFDITEERVRLEKHLAYFDETLCCKDSGGKKLGFITQEIGREINTIGSKANDADIQKIVVQMKDELEKIKEQLMNVL